MSEPFDPYYTWLGIRPADQPPNHYRLLGLEKFEDNPDVIANAADQRMAHLRTIKLGDQLAHSQRLLNEISQARVTLLNLNQKAIYDAQLQEQIPVLVPTALPVATPLTGSAPIQTDPQTGDVQANRENAKEDDLLLGLPRPLVLIGGSVAALILVVGIILAASLGGGPVAEEVASQTKPAEREQQQDPLPSESEATTFPATTSDSKTEQPTGITDQPPTSNEQDTTPEANFESKLPDPSTPGPSPRADMPEEPEETLETAQNTPPLAKSNPAGSAKESSPESIKAPTKDPLAGGAESSASQVDEEAEQQVASAAETASEDPTVSFAEPKEEKLLPVPDQAARTKVLRTVEEVFGEEMKAASTPSELRQLALTLLRHAAESRGEPVTQYVLTNKAYEMAVKAADAALIDQAVEAQARVFDVDALRLKASGFFAASSEVGTENLQRALIQQSFQLMDEAAAADRFEIAVPMEKVLINCNRRLRDAELRKETRERVERIEDQAKKFEQVAPAKAKLVSMPDDPVANAILGKYLCLSKGNWEQGLIHLSKCSAVPLSELAQQDLEILSQSQPDPETLIKIGDAWFDFAESDAQQEGYYGRADFWYRTAAPNLKGLIRRKLEQRLEITAKHVVGPEASKVIITPAVSKTLLESKESEIALVWAIWHVDSDLHRFTYVLFANGAVNAPTSEQKWKLEGDTLIFDTGAEAARFRMDAGGLTGSGRILRGAYFKGRIVWANTNPKNPKVVNVWNFKIEGDPNPMPLVFFANGKIASPDGKSTWSATNSEMVVTFPEGVCILAFQPDGTAKGDWQGKQVIANSAISESGS